MVHLKKFGYLSILVAAFALILFYLGDIVDFKTQ